MDTPRRDSADGSGIMVAPETVFHLVHGTFARGAAWTGEDSLLCRTLREAFGDAAKFERFEWSGENSHDARFAAGTELARHLEASFDEHPTAKHAVVAHSHGGNVALYATRRHTVASRLAGVICLATPFMRATVRLPLVVFFKAAFAVPFGLFLTAFGVITIYNARIPEMIETQVTMVVVGFIFASLGVPLTYKYCREPLEEAREMRAEAAMIVQDIAVPATYSMPILCIRVVNDEARNLLVGLHWITVLFRVLYLVFVCFVVLGTLGLALMGSPASCGGVALLVGIGFHLRQWLTWLVRGTSAGYGGEQVEYYTCCNIWASTWLPQASNITRSRHFVWIRGLVHCAIYNQPPVLATMVDWLRTHTIPRPAEDNTTTQKREATK